MTIHVKIHTIVLMNTYFMRGGKRISRVAFNKKRPPLERFLSFVKKTDGCWFWMGALKENGYGAFGVNYKSGYAHRFSYEQFRGPIPSGLALDHLCRVRNCVNPKHLEAVTDRENILRGDSPAAKASRRPTCINGHEYSEENTYKYGGARQCKICRAQHWKNLVARNLEYLKSSHARNLSSR